MKPSMAVEYLDHMGSDASVVNAARVSFGIEAREDVNSKDINLIRYLARGLESKDWLALLDKVAEGTTTGEEAAKLIWQIRNAPTHFAPFTHPQVSLRVTAPISTARQLWKSHIGVVGGDVGYSAWSEISRRYYDAVPDYDFPTMHKAADNVKQGRSNTVDQKSTEVAINHLLSAADGYEYLLAEGVAPEDAREILPMCTLTSWQWTGSLYFWAKIVMLRRGHGAQGNAQTVAGLIEEKVEPLFPHSWKALTKGE